jgi:hypothetical protein
MLISDDADAEKTDIRKAFSKVRPFARSKRKNSSELAE